MSSENIPGPADTDRITQAIVLDDSCPPITRDPPPPYPSTSRRSRRSRRNQQSRHTQFSSGDSHSDPDATASPQGLRSSHPFPYSTEDEGREPSETTPFLASVSLNHRYSGRPRAFSHASTVISSASAAPSLAHTLLSIFNPDDDEETIPSELDEQNRVLVMGEDEACVTSRPRGIFSRQAWGRYFRPMTRKAYYMSLFHLLVVNFPFGLVAWVYLFVGTLTGTILLMALPLGAGICFLNLLGARAFARGEVSHARNSVTLSSKSIPQLALQTRFHSPLAFPAPYPPRPLFTRYREPTIVEIESGVPPGTLIPERSFFKNLYAMFTDPTSYQALFYFLIVKPGITLVLGLLLLVLTPVSFVLIFPAPFALRAARKLGIWQANIAVEGLYQALR
ncbi:hypothetical protein HGRIS_003140 [Hohenbuehelia grisea]|uniref:Sensor domain-containing protein n=1 Tax=Hohenbuehelia grisea TaxID=104357 RepID=A0ABR3JPF3_9AGAR